MTREPICMNCKHFVGSKAGKLICKAFPDSIPSAILFDKNDHSRVQPGQQGDYVFKPIRELAKETD
jgi:hypothetical protein